jgi:hypothetical protein
MDTLVNHFEAYLGLYMLLVIVLLAAGTILAIDLLSPRSIRGKAGHEAAPDHTRSVHMNHPWAGMDESGPAGPELP